MATKRERELERLLKQERARSERLEKKLDELLERVDEQQKQIRDLVRKLNEALRLAKRQAAPFARRARKQHREKPGRKPGHPGASQPIPEHVDEEIIEPLEACPCCGGAVSDVVDHEQFVVDLPKVEPHVRRIVTQSGHCDRCCKRVRSTHPDQVSSAAGAARVALGPNVLGLAADLKHRYGMAYRDVADLIGARTSACGSATARWSMRAFGSLSAARSRTTRSSSRRAAVPSCTPTTRVGGSTAIRRGSGSSRPRR